MKPASLCRLNSKINSVTSIKMDLIIIRTTKLKILKIKMFKLNMNKIRVQIK